MTFSYYVNRLPPDRTNAFIKFEGVSELFNIYDAGNFMTGKAYSMLGIHSSVIKIGAHANNAILCRDRTGKDGSFKDSDGDQKALEKGANYPYVIWKK